MPNTPNQRTTRSNSNTTSAITLNDIKHLIEKSEILTSLKKETEEISSKLSVIIKRVDELERRNVQLEHRCNQLEIKTQDMSTFILDEFEDRLRRKKSLIISGIPEQLEGPADQRSASDDKEVKNVVESLCEHHGGFSRIHRIGRFQSDKDRLLRVVFSNEEDAKAILYRAKQLRNTQSFRYIFINPDFTPFQRECNKRLREELKRRRDLGEDVIIRGGKTVARKQTQNFQKGF